MTGKRKAQPGPAARSPRKKTKSNSSRSSTKSTSKPPRKSSNLLENCGFKLSDPRNPLAGTVVDDILPIIYDQRGRIGQTERGEEESNKENTKISLDDDEVLDLPDLPFKIFLLQFSGALFFC